jgi:hypothetical protein
VQPGFLCEYLIVQPDIETAVRHAVIIGDDDVDALQAGIDRSR